MRALTTIALVLVAWLEVRHCTPIVPRPTQRSSYDTALAAVAYELGAQPQHLRLVIGLESGHNPKARNPHTGATGLIQWMPATAQAMGTDTATIARMGRVAQLDLVRQYLSPWRGQLGTLDRLYLAVFFPAAMHRDSSWVLRAKDLPAWRVAAQNPIFDTNGDGVVQRYEVAQYLRRRSYETTKSTTH